MFQGSVAPFHHTSRRNRRVLLVFDDPQSPARYLAGLHGAGFDVVLDADFDSAVVTAAVKLPDVIVVDSRERRSECARFLQRTFTDARLQSIPVVMIVDGSQAPGYRLQSPAMSVYPRFDAPHCLGSHLLRWFAPAESNPSIEERSMSGEHEHRGAALPSDDEVRDQSAYEGRRSPAEGSSTEPVPPRRPAGGQPTDSGDRIGPGDRAIRQRMQQDGLDKSD